MNVVNNGCLLSLLSFCMGFKYSAKQDRDDVVAREMMDAMIEKMDIIHGLSSKTGKVCGGWGMKAEEMRIGMSGMMMR